MVWRLVAASALLWSCQSMPGPSLGQAPSSSATAAREILERYCGRCHVGGLGPDGATVIDEHLARKLSSDVRVEYWRARLHSARQDAGQRRCSERASGRWCAWAVDLGEATARRRPPAAL